MQMSSKGFVLVLFVILTKMAMYDGTALEKCYIAHHVKEQILEYYADCSYRNLKEIPNDLPTNTTCMNMAGNKISLLDGKTWQWYPLLKRLSLSRNLIGRVRSEDFSGLSNLEMLDLSLNQIRYTSINEDAFRPLKVLRFLDIKQDLPSIWMNETYPEALQHLRHLHTLVIDGFGTQILPYMPELVELYMSGEYGRCNIPKINGTEFENTLGVQNLFISNCSIKKIEFNSFKSLQNITSLDLSWNINLGMESVPNITSGLNGRKTFKRLNINTLYDHSQFDFCSSIDINDIKYLLNTSIELITIENNNIVRMDTATVFQWPKSIKYLSVQHNMFLYGNYTPLMILTGMLDDIVYLDISRMAAANRPVYTSGCAVSEDKKPEEQLQPNTQENSQSTATASTFHSLCMSMFTRHLVRDYFQVIEDKLKQHNIGTNMYSPEMHSLTMANKLEYLDLSENLPVLIERMFEIFPMIPNLKVLNVSRNYLGYPLYDGTSILGNLQSIRSLDLSDNKIIHLLPQIFNNLTKLKDLYLSRNKISNITFDLSHLKNLSYLDLEDNNLESINLATREALDKQADIRINIAKNDLKCTCENMGFLLWVRGNKNKLAKLEATNCTFKNGTSTSLASLQFEQLRLECKSVLLTIILASSSILIFVITTSCVLVYRFRWSLRYHYYMTKYKLLSGYQRIDNVEYEKEVFVSYAEEDRDFVLDQVIHELDETGGISLLTEDVDFELNKNMVDNIMHAIKSTRKTLVILTTSFIDSKWRMFELKMSLVESKRKVVGVLKEDIPHNDLPLEVKHILQNRTYLEYPTNRDNLQQFWDRLKETLRH